MGDWFQLSYFSQGFISNALIAFVLVLFFIADARQRRQRTGIALFFLGNALLSVALLWGSVARDVEARHFIWLMTFQFVGVTSLLRYVYRSPARLSRKEEKAAYLFSFVLHLASIYELMHAQPKYSFQIHSLLYPIPIVALNIFLHLIWSANVAARQSIPGNSYRLLFKLVVHKGFRFLFKRNEKGARSMPLQPIYLSILLFMFSVLPILYLVHNAGLLDPSEFYTVYQNYFLFSHVLFVYMIFSFGRQATGYLVKTTGFALITVISAGQLMSYLSLNQINESYNRERSREIPYIVSDFRAGRNNQIPIDVSYILAIDENNQVSVFARLSEIKELMVENQVQPERGKEASGFREVAGKYFVRYRHSVAGVDYEIGFPYELFRREYHENVFGLSTLLLGICFFALLFFPLAIRKGIIDPLKQITIAFARIRAGYLGHSVTVSHHDEIGLMAAGFNRMAAALKQVEKKIRNYTENLEDMAERRSTEIKEKVRLLENLNDELGKEVSEKNRIAEDLRNSKRFLSKIAGASPQILFLYDLVEKNLLYTNKLIPEADRFGNDFPGSLGYQLLFEDMTVMKNWLINLQKMNSEIVQDVEYRVRSRNGEVLWINTRASVFMRTAEGLPKQIIGTIVDVSERKLAQEKVLYLAHHDSLTSLPNRIKLQSIFEDSVRENAVREMALLFLDLDRFKWVNDNLGHESGDLLLMSVALQLRRLLEPGDILSRWGGDEFVVLIRSGENIIERSNELAQDILKSMADPFLLAGREVYITGSIGIAVYPTNGQKLSQLLRRADMAMYAAKDSGRACTRFFDETIERRSAGKIDLERELRYALDNNEFVVYYQPKVNLRSRQIVGVEALVRWNKNGEDLIPPDRFLPLSEETGLIMEISRKVFTEAFAQVADWKKKGIRIPVSVNVSNRQFHEQNLTASILNLMQEQQIQKEDVELELTESIIIDQSEVVLKNLDDLKNLGFHISLDDFGTGYSSLNSLRKLPISKIKIDKSFVADLDTGDTDSADLISAIVAFARKLKLKIVAEGIETDHQLNFLLAAGVDEGQGFFFGKPMPAANFDDLFADRSTVHE
ncbi:MAG: EAL domain-containing protein [Leptospiraceae bacterium]|nr:EAL domain-containing protein [Leptospiraceae bacterium]